MDSATDDPFEIYTYLVEQLNKREGLLYVHFVEPREQPAAPNYARQIARQIAQESCCCAPNRLFWPLLPCVAELKLASLLTFPVLLSWD